MTFEIYKDSKSEYRWRLKADNGKIVADSAEGYATKAGAEAGINLVKRGAAGAEVVDLTVQKAASGYGSAYGRGY